MECEAEFMDLCKQRRLTFDSSPATVTLLLYIWVLYGATIKAAVCLMGMSIIIILPGVVIPVATDLKPVGHIVVLQIMVLTSTSLSNRCRLLSCQTSVRSETAQLPTIISDSFS